MPWNSTFPLGSVSVKANRAIGQQNTTYTEVTMGNSIVGTNTVTTRDHFWKVGSNEDGRHRFINSPAFTVGGLATDPVIGSGMDAVLYLKTINGRAEWFHRNTAGIYQATPGYLTGVTSIPSDNTYSDIIAVPANVWGEIFIWNDLTGRLTGQTGFFRSDTLKVDAWSLFYMIQGTSSAAAALKLANGSEATNLNIRVRKNDGLTPTNNWNYRITYRAI